MASASPLRHRAAVIVLWEACITTAKAGHSKLREFRCAEDIYKIICAESGARFLLNAFTASEKNRRRLQLNEH